MSEIQNTLSNKLLTGTSDDDTIQNGGYWFENYRDEDETFHKGGDNVTINAGAGDDHIYSCGANVIINAGIGDDYVNNSLGSSKIFGDLGNDRIYNLGSNVTISGGDGDDDIANAFSNSKNSSISGGNGDDYISNDGDEVTIDAGAGNDTISNYIGSNVTITGGTGNDIIYNNYDIRSDSIRRSAYLKSDNIVLFKYNSGDGNDTIYGFYDTDTLSISGSSYSTEKSGDNLVVNVDNGKIMLIGVSSANIKFNKSSSTNNSWKLSGTTAKYGTSSKTLVTVNGVKSTNGLSISGKKVTIANSALNKAKVTVSNGYTLALGKDVAKPTTKKAWSIKNSVATYSQTTTAGYKLASNAKSISYSKKTTKTLATVTGAKKSSGFTISGNKIKLATASLSKKVTISGSYAFEFAKDYKNGQISGSSAGDTIINNGSNVTISGGKGNDTLTGGSGKDIFVYSNGDGNDIITNFDENDRISIKSGAAKVSTSGNDVIFSVGSGKITLQKAKGKKITYYASGKENIYTETKTSGVSYSKNGKLATLKDTYSKESFEPSDYSDYADTIVTINAAAVEQALKITGNNKKNRITGTSEDDTIFGGAGGDTIVGKAGNDELYGEKGNDSIVGGAGSDTLWGGLGNDTLTGGADSDIFYYKDGDGDDIITDFDSSMDKIIVSATNIGYPVASKGDVTFTVGNGKIVIKDGASKFIQLYGENGVALDRKYNPN